jgi:16S rRNA (uracil1498-N3)-methyltransferase
LLFKNIFFITKTMLCKGQNRKAGIAMRRFYLENSPTLDSVLLNGDEARHIIRVLRLKRDDEIVLFDATGTAYSARIAERTADTVIVRITETFAAGSPDAPRIVLAQAVLKSQKMDLIVQKSTELGVSRIMPFFSSRCITRWDRDKAAQKQHHWQQIAISAVKQSGVRRVPVVDQAGSFEEALAGPFEGFLKVLLWEQEKAVGFGSLLAAHRPCAGIVFVVGPEGGFSDAEAELARRHGFIAAGLGATILRAETVPLAVLAIIGYETGIIG